MGQFISFFGDIFSKMAIMRLSSRVFCSVAFKLKFLVMNSDLGRPSCTSGFGHPPPGDICFHHSSNKDFNPKNSKNLLIIFPRSMRFQVRMTFKKRKCHDYLLFFATTKYFSSFFQTLENVLLNSGFVLS